MTKKVGVSLKIDVSKIDKNRLFKGQKGTYLDATVFINLEEEGQYGDHGMITQDVSREERDQGERGAILGNCKVFYRDEGRAQSYQQQPSPPAATSTFPDFDGFDDDVPF